MSLDEECYLRPSARQIFTGYGFCILVIYVILLALSVIVTKSLRGTKKKIAQVFTVLGALWIPPLGPLLLLVSPILLIGN